LPLTLQIKNIKRNSGRAGYCCVFLSLRKKRIFPHLKLQRVIKFTLEEEEEREREREVLSPFQTLAACKNWAEMEYMSSMGSLENFNCG
jgi:hypothetical protein